MEVSLTMTRELLINNIENITSDAIIEFFDKLMALCCLYNVFGYDNVHITKNDDLSFDLLFEDENAANMVYNRSNGLRITLYGIEYSIESCFVGCNVHILLNTPGRG